MLYSLPFVNWMHPHIVRQAVVQTIVGVVGVMLVYAIHGLFPAFGAFYGFVLAASGAWLAARISLKAQDSAAVAWRMQYVAMLVKWLWVIVGFLTFMLVFGQQQEAVLAMLVIYGLVVISSNFWALASKKYPY